MVAAMRNMTASAILLFDRTMQKLLVLKLVGESRQNLIFAYTLGFIVALHAQRSHIIFQQGFHCRSMWGMTVHTAIDIGRSAVPVLGVFGYFLYILVTCIAHEGCDGFNHLWVISPVRVMAANAVVLCRLVNKFKFTQLVFCHYMTGKTKLPGFRGQ